MGTEREVAIEPRNTDMITDSSEHRILPQELIDWIIDWVAILEPSCLPACSLISRAWVHRSQLHIHSSIIIDIQSRDENLPHDMYASSIASFVKRAKIYCMPIELFDDDLMWRIIARLEKLEMLSLVAYDGATSLHGPITALGYSSTFLSSIDTLILESCDFLDFYTFSHFLTYFPSLRHLNILAIEVQHSDASSLREEFAELLLPPTDPDLTLEHLESLTLQPRPALDPDLPTDGSLYPYVGIVEVIAKRHRTQFHLKCPISIDVLASTLPILGEVLTELTLTTHEPGVTWTASENDTGISTAVKLSHITIEDLSHNISHATAYYTSVIPKLLSQVASTSLRTITFNGWPTTREHHLRMLNLPKIDDILTYLPSFSQLSEVRIILFRKEIYPARSIACSTWILDKLFPMDISHLPQIAEAIRHYFSLTDARGILRIDYQ